MSTKCSSGAVPGGVLVPLPRMGKGTRRPQAAKSPAKTSRSGAPRSWRPTRMQEKDYFFPCPSRAAKLWLIRSPELWMSWSMDWYRTG